MNVPERCDVVVIGGGPAGSIAGTLLSQKGYDVVLFDKERHPRYRVGESLIPHFWKYCDLAGVSDKIAADGFVQKVGGVVVWKDEIRKMAFKDFGYARPAMHVERDRFDLILLEHAREKGVRIFEDVAVLRADFDHGEEVSVVYRPVGEEGSPGRISCRFIIDASGQNSVLGRQLGTRIIDDDFRFMSVWGYFKNSKYVALDGRVQPFENLFSVPPVTFVSSLDKLGEWGWAWHIPMRESTSVGLVVPLDELKAIKASDEALEAYFLRKCRETPYLDRLLESAEYIEGSFHVIRDYSYRATQVAGPGFFLTGDAAAFVDPIFSVGIVFAMYSAYVAVWAIDRSIRDPASTAKNQALFSSQLQARLEVSRALALPQYSAAGKISELAQTAVHFESALEKELMYVVSTFTTRNENVQAMVQRKDGGRVTSERYQTLEKIIF